MSTQVEPLPMAHASPCAAPLTGWRRVLLDWFVVGWATAVCQALGVVMSLVLRAALTPAQMGVWQALKLVLSNGNYANLGVSKGAAREYTIALGRRDDAAAERAANLAFTVNTFTSAIYSLALIAAAVGIAAWSDSPWAGVWATGLAVVGALSMLQRYSTFQVTLLRARQDFTITARLSMLEAALSVGVGGLAAWWWGLSGVYLGTAAVLTASIWFLHRNGVPRFRMAWDFREIRRLAAIGTPILLAGVVTTLFRSLDKLMILGYLPDREFQLGCYSLALMVTGQLYGLGNMLSIVIGPRLGERYGHSNRRADVALLTVQSSELLAAALALPAALCMVALPTVLGRWFPDYETGIVPMLLLIPGTVAGTLALTPSQYLVAVDRQKWSLAAVVLATAVMAVANHAALVSGQGINGVALTTGAASCAYFLFAAAPLWRDLEPAGRRRFLSLHLMAVLPTLSVAAALEWIRPSVPADLGGMASKILAVSLVWLLSAAIVWKSGRWHAALQNVPHSPCDLATPADE